MFENFPQIDFNKPNESFLFNIPEGAQAFYIAKYSNEYNKNYKKRPLLWILDSEVEIVRIRTQLKFFDAGLKILSFPAWDVLPFDRVSPKGDIVARRLSILSHLLHQPLKNTILLTSVNAVLQRVPPKDVLHNNYYILQEKTEVFRDNLSAFLIAQGYNRVETVRERGEFSWRGGLLDIFPPSTPSPYRVDFFGDEIETIKPFDIISQMTRGKGDKVKSITLLPMSELFLSDETIMKFCRRYRNLFGTDAEKDSLYNAVQTGQYYQGMEHWLPLFHDKLATIFDYLGDCALAYNEDILNKLDMRLETIADYYTARSESLNHDLLMSKKNLAMGQDATSLYRPLPSDELYLTQDEILSYIDRHARIKLSPHNKPSGTNSNQHDIKGAIAQDFSAARKDKDMLLFNAVAMRIKNAKGKNIIFCANKAVLSRIASLLEQHDVQNIQILSTGSDIDKLADGGVGLAVMLLHRGFQLGDVAAYCENDIFGESISRTKPSRKRKGDAFIKEATALSKGDLVVHENHGIGRFKGLVTVNIDGAPHECALLEYGGGDKLYLPVENIEVLSRFGGENSIQQLDSLGSAAWQLRKAKVKDRLKDMADKLLKIAAMRELQKGDVIFPPSSEYQEFASRFPFDETDDQQNAINDVFDDLQSGRLMDRLICGDVGFGKTEIALRAAFAAAMNGAQTAVVVPTTLLARQHGLTFEERFSGLPIKVATLSRLVNSKVSNEIKQGLKDGNVDIVIGTHKLLSKHIQFKNLKLLIIDEEQHFGVRQKERLKEIATNIHVLTLTATPIPRTLQMALTGVRDMSIIATPPIDRLAVHTFVLPYDKVVIKEALIREKFRGGQIFAVAPRISDLADIEKKLRTLMPNLRMAVAHGRMPPQELENVMNDFVEGHYDILLSTNIIESGIDIPKANTLLIFRCDMFGLSQLYQLRGRVGRSKQRGYCYMILSQNKRITADAEKRLSVMQTLDSLGAGFTLASHDLDIRGAGNLLGEEQSGHVREVGVELFQRLLEEAVHEARKNQNKSGHDNDAGKGKDENTSGGEGENSHALNTAPHNMLEYSWSPQLNLGVKVLIPEYYVGDVNLRMSLYQRLSEMLDKQDIDKFAVELIDRFGPLPNEVNLLLAVTALKIQCRHANIEKITAGEKGMVIQFRGNMFKNPEKLVEFLSMQKGSAKLRPDHALVIIRSWNNKIARLNEMNKIVSELARLAKI